MKSSVELPNGKESNLPYPKLMISSLTGNIFLMKTKNRGVIVHPANSSWSIGEEIRSDGYAGDFIYYDGSVILSNDGKWKHTESRDLFWGEIKFDIPKPPKKKVKKYRVLFKPKHGVSYSVSIRYYKSIQEFQRDYPTVIGILLIKDSMIYD